ncbi:MAG: type I-Fv CRISPR-associated protein Cas7fv [Candidatus Riflebacteria bacterium]|nr:type I-Fv CRISPR-associated protein Cas7fv [Candidatus Riflebacteria bacterium]
MISGIRSVDFFIEAAGYGVVNWNGSAALMGDSGTEINNHTLPKLRGYSNLTGKVKEENNYKYKKQASDIDFKETPLYISQNCIRHHLFRDQAFDTQIVTQENAENLLVSITGLIRGYVIPACQYKRTSPLLLEDFVEILGNGNFEQMGRCGSKDKEETKSGKDKSTSIFSKTTFGETAYKAYGSINIEQLQFISLDNKFGRAAINVSEEQGIALASKIQTFIKNFYPESDPKAIFGRNYARVGGIFPEGEHGILLNDDAINCLIDLTLERIINLSIKQAKGYMYVEKLEVDYNDSNIMMRIKRQPEDVCPEKGNKKYAVYFEDR